MSAASGGNSEPKQGQRSQSARGFCPRSTMRVPQPDIIEHFGNADAVPQPPERCLSRKAGIVRCCLNTGQSPVRDTPDPAFFEIRIVVDCGAIHHFHLISNFSLRIPNHPTPQLFAHFSSIFFTFFVTFSFIWCILIARIRQKKQILRFCTHQCYGPKQTEVSIHVL